MTIRRFLVLAALLAPGVAAAQEPEQLLSSKTQLYFRWDGQKAHREAYLGTAVGKMMQGDTGKMIDNLLGMAYDAVNSQLTVKGLLEGAPPEQVQKMQTEAAQAMKLPALLSDNGLLVAAEVESVLPPAFLVTLVVPDAGDKAESLFAALRLVGSLNGFKMGQQAAGNRKVSTLDLPPVQVGWWREGKHAVVMACIGNVMPFVRRLDEADRPRLTAAPLFKQLAGFKDFRSSARAFLDLQAVVKMAGAFSPEIKKGIEAVGLDSLKAVTLVSGYEGEAERGLLEMHYSGERKGLLAMSAGKPFKLADVPPLPADTITWSMSTFDAAGYYDGALKVVETLATLYAPNEGAQIKEAIKQIDQTLGIDLRKDLLGALDNRLLIYSSPGEGVFTLSQTMAFKVKDGSKLLDTLDQTAKGLAGLAGAKIAVKKRKYRDVETREVRINEQGFFFLPTYSIVNDWLVISYFPQAVHGYILRSKNELPTWKPEESVTRSLDKLPREFHSVSVSDPRPSIKQVFALAPLVGAGVRSVLPDSKFDPALIPNSHEACKHLFPNVTVLVDDGKTTRMHTRASLALPLDVAGVDTYILAVGGLAFFSAFFGQ